MREYKITYTNNIFNIICIWYIKTNSKKEARRLFNKEHKEYLKKLEIIDIEREI